MVLFLFQHTFIPISVWKLTIYHGQSWSIMASSSSHCPSSLPTLGPPRGRSVGILMYLSRSALLLCEKTITSRSLGLNVLIIQGSSGYLFLLPAFFPLVLSRFLVEHVAPWLPNILNMLEDILHWCSIVKDFIMNISADHMLKGLPLLHLVLWLLRDMCCTDKGSLPKSVRQWQG